MYESPTVFEDRVDLLLDNLSYPLPPTTPRGRFETLSRHQVMQVPAFFPRSQNKFVLHVVCFTKHRPAGECNFIVNIERRGGGNPENINNNAKRP